ncbi:hypothetical protein [Ancylomarina longa]|uniref:Linear amide C-N hydrolase n=1 Tax=Ancylomarina longa TaxID=2487017 RepID=A0A434AW88_9BACT|nr:hypothetical protein [Ancylomarina longa]RUT78743.1 hypothetical protein DLK05_06280 [Ancylomarina longa]
MKKSLSCLLILLAFAYQGIACTTAVISGKYTKDGRPMIWKLRDSDSFQNKLMYFANGKYDCIGLINSNDAEGEQVWGGSNSEGFAIMNSASYNVNLNDTTSFKDQEGYFMKQALQNCATLEDFEQLLQNRAKPMGLAAHFGVIDAKGNAAFYEVNNYTFTKFDANDPAQAPNGYILRTNFSFTGKKDIGYGFIRFQTAQDLFYQADACGNLNVKTIIQKFSRCLKHAVLKKDFRKEYEQVPYGDNFINSDDLITRNSSASMILVEGVKKGENPLWTTIWTMIGYPNTCLAIPVWMAGGKDLPNMLQAKGTENCKLNEIVLGLKAKCYPITRAAGNKYLNVSELVNAEHTGIIQNLESAENMIFDATQNNLKVWRDKKPEASQIQEYYHWLNNYTIDFYKHPEKANQTLKQ